MKNRKILKEIGFKINSKEYSHLQLLQKELFKPVKKVEKSKKTLNDCVLDWVKREERKRSSEYYKEMEKNFYYG